ncbi:predicted protein [Coccidioides posadasii str. Silveira]|uniref:Predicted protein n=1 Tax=Coccidioides posadasii (strain RMSCC 757 / Silveira) TaxID=443226 RepID=E9D7M2_COCPS|nr:predicted protein [Coccidioides posadasii str. Silveira]
MSRIFQSRQKGDMDLTKNWVHLRRFTGDWMIKAGDRLLGHVGGFQPEGKWLHSGVECPSHVRIERQRSVFLGCSSAGFRDVNVRPHRVKQMFDQFHRELVT